MKREQMEKRTKWVNRMSKWVNQDVKASNIIWSEQMNWRPSRTLQIFCHPRGQNSADPFGGGVKELDNQCGVQPLN